MTERPQNKNLTPITTLSSEEAKRRGSAGGKASVKKRRERKTLKETLELIGDLPMHEGKLLDLSKAKNIDQLINANKTVKDQIAVRLAVMAQNGNLRAIELIRDQIGERPATEVKLSGTVLTRKAEDLTDDELEELIGKLKG